MAVRVHLHNSLLYIENAYGHLAMTIACLSSRLSLSQREERLVMTAYGQGADLLFLAAVCVAGSKAESEAGQGAGVWREAQEAQASLIGWDAQRRECRRD